MFAIVHAHVMTMEQQDFSDGFVLVEDGIIREVGDMCDFHAACETISANGAFLYPGFVDAHCHLGMWEECIGAEGDDGNEDTDPVTPHLRAIDAINPADRAFADARAAGVCTVVSGPGSANVFGGQFAALKTAGVCIDDMILRAPVAQKISLGENPKMVYGTKNVAPSTRMATAALIRETLKKAQEYQRSWQEYDKDPEECDRPEFDFKSDSLLPVLQGEIGVKFHAHRADDIFTAIRLAKEFSLSFSLEHCTEGHLIADYLKGQKVITGPALGSRSKVELSALSFATPAVLSKAGVRVAIMTDHPEVPISYLPLCAALAVREGMEEREALRAITLYAAQCCSIEDRVGSIAPGKDADLVLTKYSPLDLQFRPEQVWINGVEVL